MLAQAKSFDKTFSTGLVAVVDRHLADRGFQFFSSGSVT